MTRYDMPWSEHCQQEVFTILNGHPVTQIATLNSKLATLQQVDKMTIHNCEDIEKILLTKPARPPMVSTLTQRWAATGGMPPC